MSSTVPWRVLTKISALHCADFSQSSIFIKNNTMPRVNITKSQLPRKTKKQKIRAAELLEMLDEEFPNPKCALNHSNAFELLIATILSAQCTDERVNIVTADLFQKYQGPEVFAAAALEEIEQDVKSTGFYRNKAKSIQETSAAILDRFNGEVPKTMEELLSLRGVARKTANVVLGNAYGINVGVVVDTHVKRLSNRYGLTKHANVEKIEMDLMALFPLERWTDLSHLLIYQGRKYCNARPNQHVDNPLCLKFGTGYPCTTSVPPKKTKTR
jgi:endonuclease-3